MTTVDVGDEVDLEHLVYNADRTLTDATVALSLTAPDGTVTAPSVSHFATGTYRASFTASSAGVWAWTWTVSGAVVAVDYGNVFAANPGPLTYATVPELKGYLGVTDTTDDARLLDCLVTATRGIEKHCGRKFYAETTASARMFKPRDSEVCLVDDFWTTTGLIVKIDSGDDGNFSTTIDSTQYELEPFNGVVDGESGWPYYQVRSLNCAFLTWNRRRGSVQVTAKWGWSAVPAPIKLATVYMAEEAFKLKGAPFGVVSMDQFGPIRMRANPKVLEMIAPYRTDVIQIA